MTNRQKKEACAGLTLILIWNSTIWKKVKNLPFTMTFGGKNLPSLAAKTFEISSW